jgi:hypothetical protein
VLLASFQRDNRWCFKELLLFGGGRCGVLIRFLPSLGVGKHSFVENIP